MAKVDITEVHFGSKIKVIKQAKRRFVVKQKGLIFWVTLSEFKTLRGSISFIQSILDKLEEDEDPHLGGELVFR